MPAVQPQRDRTTKTEEAARTVWHRLAGCRFELEASLREVGDLPEDRALVEHLQGGLLDVEAGLQLVERLLPPAACTTP